jgi:hypothetical protein
MRTELVSKHVCGSVNAELGPMPRDCICTKGRGNLGSKLNKNPFLNNINHNHNH